MTCFIYGRQLHVWQSAGRVDTQMETQCTFAHWNSANFHGQLLHKHYNFIDRPTFPQSYTLILNTTKVGQALNNFTETRFSIKLASRKHTVAALKCLKCYIPDMTERSKLLCSLDSSTQLLNVEEKGQSEYTEVDLYQHGAASCDTPTCSKTSLLAPRKVKGFNYSQIHKVFRHMHHFEELKHFKFFLSTCWKCKKCFQVA